MNTFGGMRRNRRSGCGGCVLPIIGLVFLIIGIYMIRDTLTFLPGTVTTQGTIIHCTYNEDDNTGDDNIDGSSCSPTVRFTAQSGRVFTIESSTSSSTFSEGQTLQVRYHPATPQDGRVDSFFTTWLLPLILCGFGFLMLILGPLVLFKEFFRGLFFLLFLRPRV